MIRGHRGWSPRLPPPVLAFDALRTCKLGKAPPKAIAACWLRDVFYVFAHSKLPCQCQCQCQARQTNQQQQQQQQNLRACKDTWESPQSKVPGSKRTPRNTQISSSLTILGTLPQFVYEVYSPNIRQNRFNILEIVVVVWHNPYNHTPGTRKPQRHG